MKVQSKNNSKQKVAILSDVHGNLPALEAVIADAHEQGVEVYWNLGDILGGGPFVNEVVELLFDACSEQVLGNYDVKVLKFPEKQEQWKASKKPQKYTSLKWFAEKLSKRNRKRLQGLKQQDRLSLAGWDVLLTHGGPAALDELVGPDTSAERLEDLARLAEAELVLCGHTHVPFHEKAGGVTFINPGSVGRPFGADVWASYAILEIGPGVVDVSFQKASYDVGKFGRALRKTGLPGSDAVFGAESASGQTEDGVVDGDAIELLEPAERLADVRAFAVRCDYDASHSEQVTQLAGSIFDQLRGVHHLGREELFLLTCAGIVHDIGWLQGQKGHHKMSMEMIMQDATMPLAERERQMIALTARYHRRALPKRSHAVYGELSREDRQVVVMLGGILRVADGLDRSHMSVVKAVDVQVGVDGLEFRCQTIGPALPEMHGAQKKASLLEQAAKMKTRFMSV